jgi:hypothetical protein
MTNTLAYQVSSTMTKNKGLMTLTPGAVDSADPNGDVIKGLLDMLPDWLQLLAVAAPWSVELEHNELKKLCFVKYVFHVDGW